MNILDSHCNISVSPMCRTFRAKQFATTSAQTTQATTSDSKKMYRVIGPSSQIKKLYIMYTVHSIVI